MMMNKNQLKRFFPVVIIEDESVLKIILRFIEHNPGHSLNINFLGKNFNPCARCFGTWVGGFSGLLLFSPFLFGMYAASNFFLAFLVAWLFVLPSIVDWSTIKLGLRTGNNNIRFFVGFLHGIGVVIYFFVLPAGILFKLVTYGFYGFVFVEIRRKIKLNQVKKNVVGG